MQIANQHIHITLPYMVHYCYLAGCVYTIQWNSLNQGPSNQDPSELGPLYQDPSNQDTSELEPL